ncbi:amylo-alpha-1,6-glucosidase [Lederbergia wuyishanensis]|uniref:Glycogen debranching enzyme n=1 Tax=Lederbergia wuyishanensis TaxID=1347903 RepID=A0ABU0D9Q7_9BACI|nr:trehalase family glycosidase [Lederbergia wuyishanensis]MCJ8007421.1 hypothetical protein [Lederbergia wuyishanensis]MDQ0345141.1 glycogen debranching enzyme [Lederbergia wuyishanensis]
MKLDIREIPFSRFGSYFCVSQEKDNQDIYIRDVHGGDEAPSRLFKLGLLKDGQPCDAEVEASEIAVKLSVKGDSSRFAEIIIPEEDELHIQVQGVTLSLEPENGKYDSFMELSENLYEYHIYSKELKLMLVKLAGVMDIEAPWNTIGNHFIRIHLQDGHFVLRNYRTVYKEKQYDDFATGKEKLSVQYEKWFSHMSKGYNDAEFMPSLERASYITWANFVRPEGVLPGYAMYMSKLWMYNIWSWDNCFGALLLAEKYPELAYDQINIFIEHQDESGAYPDFVNDKFSSYNCIKPPIFLYTYEKLMAMNDYFKEETRLRAIYESSKKVMSYFAEYRTNTGCLPHYKHGNDSGWDNSSLFHAGMVVEAPDLAAFLIRSCDILASFAIILGEEEESVQFKQQADQLFSLLMERLYDENGFFGRYGKNADPIQARSSLILKLPIMIGYRLEEKVKQQLVRELAEHFEANFGLATERIDSPYYKENGYWLGPIWAPVTYLFIDSLASFGFEEMAKRLRDKFLQVTLVGGMAENFDPITGKGLVDTSFAWTSSVFLLFLHEKVTEA